MSQVASVDSIRILAAVLELVLWSLHLMGSPPHTRHSLLASAGHCQCHFRLAWKSTLVGCLVLTSVQAGEQALGASYVVGSWHHCHAVCHSLLPHLRGLAVTT